MIEKFFKILNKIIELIELVLGIVMILCVVIEVLSRYVLPFSTTWCEEVARYCLVWGMMLGCAYGFGSGGHIVIDFLTHKLSDRGKAICEILANAATLVFCVIFIGLAVERFPSISKEHMVMARVSMGYVYAAVPAGFALSILYCLNNLIRLLFRREDKPI